MCLIAPGDVDDVDRVICELAREVGRQIVAARLAKQDLGARLEGGVGCERFEGGEVRRHVLADSCVRTSAGLHRADSRGG